MCEMRYPPAGTADQESESTNNNIHTNTIIPMAASPAYKISEFVHLFPKLKTFSNENINSIAANISHPMMRMKQPASTSPICWVEGAIIVGAGPAGLATAVCLQKKGIPYLILEKEDCIGSLWKYRTYDRLRLHIAKQFCELPYMNFPAHYPKFPTRNQFIEYLDNYAKTFNIQPHFEETVLEASYTSCGLWQVESQGPKGHRTFLGRWLIAATGENALPAWPKFPGLDSFQGKLCHSIQYKSGDEFQGQNVLVVGGGNSGLEVALDLVEHQANPVLSVRSPVHILPREMLGISTFSIATTLLKLFPIKWTDRLLVFMSNLILGNITDLGFKRPKTLGPMEMKARTGKTPSLDAGTLSKIRQGHIKVFANIKEFGSNGCTFEDNSYRSFDAVIFATGFKSNVPAWLKDSELFSSNGFPRPDSECNWKGKKGLYSAGFAKKGLLGMSMDAQRIADDISKLYCPRKLVVAAAKETMTGL